ncbi:MAG: hypothetical protein HQM10_19445 [Candidatus Riflebacteria bacterium]|nr:hypothetical protein [Candidatus Riflebacteria bacterium]
MNFHKKEFKIAFLLAAFLMLFAVSGYAQSARSRGMGGSYLAVSDDESAVFFNPAGLSQIQGREASFLVKMDERNLFRLDSAAFTGHIYEDKEKENFSVTDYLEHNILEEPVARRPKYSYGMSYTEDFRSTEFGRLIGGEFLGVQREVRDLHMGFGTRFPIARRMLARETLYGGIKLRMTNTDRWIKTLNSHAKRDAQTLGLGLMYHYNDRITGGLTVDNLVERISGESAIRDGVSLNVGAVVKLTKGTIISGDCVNLGNSARTSQQQYRIGVEKKFIENDLTMRVGSWNGTLTLGFGLHLLPTMRLDYAYYNGDVIKEHYVGGHFTFD